MTARSILHLLFLVPLAIPGPVVAARVTGLYEVEVPVATRGAEQRDAAIRAALAQVLIKVSGRSDVAGTDAARDLVRRAGDMVQQYRYGNVGDNAAGALTLEVRFDQNAVDGGLRKLGLPVWGRARPATLVWLAMESRGRTLLIDANATTTAARHLRGQADQRGLPVLLPIMDLQDQANITVADVWGGFQDAVLRASRRYQTEAVLVGRVDGAGSRWRGRWTLHEGGVSSAWQARGHLGAVIRAGVDGAGDRLAARFATATGAAVGNLLMHVAGIETLDEYGNTVRFLTSLQPVSAVNVVRVDADGVLFALDVRGGRAGFVQALALAGEQVLTQAAPVRNTEPGRAPEHLPGAREAPDRLSYRLLR